MSNRLEAAIPFIAWSRIFSPLTSEEWRDEAWRALELPGSWSDSETTFWSTFLVGVPAPEIPLLLHAALGRDGGATREEWMRVISHLGLDWAEHALPPDQLGVACELLACGIEREDDVLVRELCKRYLVPWCGIARERLAAREDTLGVLVDSFEADLQALEGA